MMGSRNARHDCCAGPRRALQSAIANRKPRAWDRARQCQTMAGADRALRALGRRHHSGQPLVHRPGKTAWSRQLPPAPIRGPAPASAIAIPHSRAELKSAGGGVGFTIQPCNSLHPECADRCRRRTPMGCGSAHAAYSRSQWTWKLCGEQSPPPSAGRQRRRLSGLHRTALRKPPPDFLPLISTRVPSGPRAGKRARISGALDSARTAGPENARRTQAAIPPTTLILIRRLRLVCTRSPHRVQAT